MMRAVQKEDLLNLALGMSDLQKRHALALTSEDNLVGTMMRLEQQRPIAAAFEREPFKTIAVAGAVPVHPGVASTFMYATDELRKVILEVSHFYRDTLFPLLKKQGIHRVHSLGPAEDFMGRRWKEDVLGAQLEAALLGYGKGVEDFVLHRILL